MSKILIVMLSNTASKEFYNMTCNAVKSLIESVNKTNLNVDLRIVETQNKEYITDNLFFYNHFSNKSVSVVHTIPSMYKEFNYNEFLNRGFENNNSYDYFMILNNDVLVENNVFYLIEQIINNTSPTDSYSISFNTRGYELTSTLLSNKVEVNNMSYEAVNGYRTSYEFLGWNIFFTKKVFDIWFPFPIELKFHGQDNFMSFLLYKNNIPHTLIKDYYINHLFSKSHSLIEEKLKNDMVGNAWLDKYIKLVKEYEKR